jgi:tetratricopeptide (TPR) repeat protein
VNALVAVLLLAAAAPAWAAPALIAEVDTVATHYHEDPARLDILRATVARAADASPRADLLVAVARLSFIAGDVRATSTEEKLAAYEAGRQAAARALEIDRRSVAAHFWYATNTARWGQTKGIARSLFLLPQVQREIETILALDPNFAPVYSLAGYVYFEVPRLLGGDLERAEAMFRKGLTLDARFTGMRVGLAKVLARRGRTVEARRELQAVLAESAPSNLADWTTKDVPEARRLLGMLDERS